MEDITPKVSIIIPCYNVEKFLDRCMESLVHIGYDNKECIFINDGSNDSTGEILNQYSERYPYVKVFHQDNKGVSEARNTGLRNANGKYIMFADPDDYVLPDFVAIPSAEMEKSQCDMLLFGYNAKWWGKFEPMLPLEHYTYNSNAQILKHFFPRMLGMRLDQLDKWLGGGKLMPDKETGQVWRWIYRQEFLVKNDIRFREVKISEDMVFNAECLLAANSMKSIDTCLYNYFPREDGAMLSSINGLDTLQNKIDLLYERIRLGEIYTKKTGKDALPLYAGSCVMSCFELGVLLSKNGGYKLYKSYISIPQVQESISRSKLRIKNKKALLPHFLLKISAYRVLYTIFLIVNRFKMRIAY